jgi:muramoyltetrapeptide carboxypeptidase
MKIIKPQRLKKGSLIGIISPASSPDDLSTVENGANYLEKLGYRVEVGKNVGQNFGYLAGTDQQRIDDIHYMFRKKDVKAIFCARGGYGTPRLLDKIDYSLIKRNPKILVGYSDITALQMAIMKKTGLVTFAGPMLSMDFQNDISEFTEEMFWKILTSNKKFGRVSQPDDEKIFELHKGQARGRIMGGNLSVFTSLVGTHYFPDLKDKILLLEEIGEMPYRIDRLLNQLRLNKAFARIKGVILGAFIDCNEHDPLKKTLSLGEVISEYLEGTNMPVVYNFKHGHIKNNITVPFGIVAKINTTKNIIEYTEAAVV